MMLQCVGDAPELMVWCLFPGLLLEDHLLTSVVHYLKHGFEIVYPEGFCYLSPSMRDTFPSIIIFVISYDDTACMGISISYALVSILAQF